MRYEEGGRALRPQAACGKDYAGGGVLAGKLLARPRGQNARRAATSVARAALAKRFRLSLPRRSEEKGCRSTIDTRVLARFVRGTMSAHGSRLNNGLVLRRISCKPNSGIPPLYRGGTMAFFRDSSARLLQWPRNLRCVTFVAAL